MIGSAGWFSKFLGRGDDNEPKATVADVGLKMEAYYDKNSKRWIFPGDDPVEVAKPLAPPPTMPRKTLGAPATPLAAPAAESNDPLAALMAPPLNRGRITSSNNKKGPPMAAASGRSRYATGPPVASMGSVSGNKKVPDSPMANQQLAPPITFAVFQPKPTASSVSTPVPSSTSPSDPTNQD